jgi:hypothetical protein
MVNVQSSTMVMPTAPSFNLVSSVAAATTTQSTVSSPSDKFAGSYIATSSSTTTTDENGKTAGFGKRMMNHVGNAFGKVADMMGFGTFAQIAKAQFNTYDTDHDNKINAGEFTAVSSIVQKSFTDVDKNANQEVSLGEFHTVVRDLVNAEFTATDTSGDGFVNFNEANARGMVVTQGNSGKDSFKNNDLNGDGLLNVREFAGLMNDMKFNHGQHAA